MKKFLISIVVILLVFAGLHFILKNRSTYKEENKLKSEEKETTTVLIDPSLSETKTYNTPTEDTSFQATYPQFKNVSPDFNKQIEDLITEAIKIHAEDAAANAKIRAPEEKYQFYSSWIPTQVNNDYISVLLRWGGYLGGAHGYENLASFNYDVKNQKELKLSDLLLSDPDYLKTISEFSRQDLRRQFKENASEDMLLAGTEPTEENFSVFTFTPEAITFYFSQYQVAPYAMGESKVVVPRK